MRKKTETLKSLQGTFRPDRASTTSLKLEAIIPTCPINLSGEARIIWDDLCRKLIDLKVLTTLDGYVLAMYCESFTRWDTLRKFLQENGDSYQSETGLCKIRPEVQSLKECLNSLDILTAKLCLSPKDREKIVLPEAKEADEFEEFLRTGKASRGKAGK